ncbi:BRO-N domain-containing protein [Chitinimonas sp. BJB300]|uniref:BRO-N domain-containing protein n=1 Tax=Chitinimonas sp. BJB300 TaxID=1559339 RepID=UPI000C0FDAB0|nr:Bro-N domain-containing protein [Chitinimonas sp. BJB300]PHV11506.1 hypothetical protein CSQ89_10455 [Chitinimonas sp. BJB300]TSJ91396.1 hypothetical protein FG002_003680 [Chitinimonas sp. BJB300]
MNQLVAFNFDTQGLRVVVGNDGAPWFIAADVLAALTLDRKALERLDGDEKGVNSIHTLGGEQEMTTVSESGLYALVLGSRKPEAKRFKRWVTSEVLPSIRKTGAYHTTPAKLPVPAPAQDRVAAILLLGEAIAQMPGVKQGIAMAATLACVAENTGLSVESLRRSLPTCDEVLASMTPTRLGQLMGANAKATNLRLAVIGLQVRNDRDDWELTEAGQTWAEARPFSRNGHSGYQILWKPTVVELLKEAA